MPTREEEFLKRLAKESKRRENKHIARCKYCGDYFIKQTLEYLIEHRKACEGRKES